MSFLSTVHLRVLLALIFLGLIITVSPQKAIAQTSPLNQPSSSIDMSVNSPHGASNAIYNFSHAISCLLIGQSPMAPCLEYKLYNDAQGIVKAVPVLNQVNTHQGLFGVGNSILTALYSSKPISSSEYLARMGEEVGLVQTAHAQVGGSGNSILAPVYKLWLVSRNIAYLVMIIVFLVVGFMVMFRQKLNPQTVVTVQLALPGLVIGLVLITFSYFLASLITDMAFLGTDLIGYYFQAAQTGPNTPASLTQLMSSQSSLSIMSRLTSGIAQVNVKEGIDSILDNLNGRADLYVKAAISFVTYQYGGQFTSAILGPIGGIIGFLAGAGSRISTGGAGSTIGTIVGQLGGGALTTIVSNLFPGDVLNFILNFILVLMLIVTIFRLIFKLLNNFLSIIFYTISSPLTFLLSSLPGRNGLVNDWVKNMLCNVLAFPAVVGVLYFCYYILTNGQPLQGGDQAFRVGTPSLTTLTGTSALPLFGGLQLGVVNALVAFAAFLATPSIPDIVCKTIGKIGPAAGMIEGQISNAQRAGQGYAKQAASAPGQLSKDISNSKALANEKGYDMISDSYKYKNLGAWNVFSNRGKPKIPGIDK